MDDHETEIRIDERLPFQTLHGESLQVDVGTVSRVGSGPVRARLRVDYETWERAVELGCFHLDSVTERPSLSPGRQVELRVRLRTAVDATLQTDLSGVKQRLIGDDDSPDETTRPVDALRQTASWYATGILQTVGFPDGMESALGNGASASVGVDTRWDDFFTVADDRPAEVATYVTDYFDGEEWSYELVEAGIYEIELSLGDRGRFSLYVYADEEERVCSLYAVHPDSVPRGARADVTDLLASRNYELERGAFGLDPASGDVRYRLRLLPDEESFAEGFDRAVSAMSSVFDEIAEHVEEVTDHADEVTDHADEVTDHADETVD